ncbi:hypothetical protein BSNK01_22590 [Bacillaceae bacterium]
MPKRQYFFCYDPRLAKFLIENNIKYITKAIHPGNLKIFWLFEQTEMLSEQIKRFKETIKKQ